MFTIKGRSKPVNVFVTSDLHFNHDNIVEACGRTTTVDAHNDWIISQCNSVVGVDDVVYHLGDFTLSKNVELIKGYISRLNGQWFMLKGNHDKRAWQSIEGCTGLGDYHETVVTSVETGKKTRLIMCHYPFQSWNMSRHGSVHLHGHTHGTIGNTVLNRFDVGLDANPDFQPYNLHELIGE